MGLWQRKLKIKKSNRRNMHSFKSPISNSYRYSAKQMAKPINFRYFESNVKSVTIMGDFNNWNPTANSMEKHFDGSWVAKIPLHHGHHHYVFVADGKHILDPNANGVGRDEKYGRVSLIAIS